MSPFVIPCLYRIIAPQLTLHIYTPHVVLVMYQCGRPRDIFYGIFIPSTHKQLNCCIYGRYSRSQNYHRLVVKPSESGQLLWCVHSPPHSTTRNNANDFTLVFPNMPSIHWLPPLCTKLTKWMWLPCRSGGGPKLETTGIYIYPVNNLAIYFQPPGWSIGSYYWEFFIHFSWHS